MAKKTTGTDVLGKWAFLIGLVLAVIIGLFSTVEGTYAIVLVVIGLIVGLLNVADEEVMPFLMSGAVLIIASSLGAGELSAAPSYVNSVLQALLAIFVPATIIVAIKNVFSIARR